MSQYDELKAKHENLMESWEALWEGNRRLVYHAESLALALEEWIEAWASQDTSGAEPARKRMFEVLENYRKDCPPLTPKK